MNSTDSDQITYRVERSRRKTADIIVERNGEIFVRAPENVGADQIAEAVRKKRYWIHKTRAEWRDLNATRILREYRNGEEFFYLGRSYRLLLVSDQDEPLQLRNGRFCLRRDIVEAGCEAARDAFKAYYSLRGLQKITQRVNYFAPKIGIVPRKIEVRALGHRWASYSPAANLAFHWKCILAPARVVDYIVVHELCHQHYMDHTDAFWNEVDKVLPRYREHKDWLRRNGASLDV